MALFGSKKKEKETPKADTATVATSVFEANAADVLKRPHVTEKAFTLSQNNVYTFEVAPNATKYQIAAAIKAVYGVTPARIRVTRKRPRTVRSMARNRTSKQAGIKKAYVSLREGDTINFM